MAVDRLIVVRHAESLAGAARRISGRPSSDEGLTPRGIEQAAALRSALRPLPLEVCIVTAFPRTQRTAELALDGRDVPIDVVPELNDPWLGHYEGRTLDDYLGWLREVPLEERPPGGGESQLASVTRYERSWRAVAARPERCALVVGHAFPISLALTLERGKGPMLRKSYSIEVAYAEPHRIDVAALRAGLDGLRRELGATRA
jgi:alpha-ribazole phosphatase